MHVRAILLHPLAHSACNQLAHHPLCRDKAGELTFQKFHLLVYASVVPFLHHALPKFVFLSYTDLVDIPWIDHCETLGEDM